MSLEKLRVVTFDYKRGLIILTLTLSPVTLTFWIPPSCPFFPACIVSSVPAHKQTTQHSASGGFINNTHINYIDIVVIRQSFQHFTDRGPDQLESQAGHTPTSAKRKKKKYSQFSVIRNGCALENAHSAYYMENLGSIMTDVRRLWISINSRIHKD